MGWRSKVIEIPLWLGSHLVPSDKHLPEAPSSVFVLRNNDLGDLLVTTPVFQALRWRFPNTHIVAGVGDWSRAILENNPYVDEILPVNMPRYNNFIKHQRIRDVIRYVAFSQEVRAIAARKFAVGIDIMGSCVGSTFMMRASIPYRLGVKGFIGGHSATQQSVHYNKFEHVGRSALRFAELLGAADLPVCRPQIFLTEEERVAGLKHWTLRQAGRDSSRLRVVIGPGGGFQGKCWPNENHQALIALISQQDTADIIIVGGKQDHNAGERLASAAPAAKNLAGKLQLRETFALVAASDLVLSNSSMLMHVAAAFRKPNFVLLGEHFPSASQHYAQWGYPETCWILGKDKERDSLFTPQEAFEYVRQYFPVL